MEAEEVTGRRTRQSGKRTAVSGALPIMKKKRSKTGSPSAKSPNQRRSSKPTKCVSGETSTETGNNDLKQGSGSSEWSISDDEELPAVMLSSPAKASQTQTYKKHDIVWIKYRNEEYWPCLITAVKKTHVNYKFINTSRKSYTYRAKISKIIAFDDPVRNAELLNIGRKTYPDIVDAFDRVKHFYCRLTEQKNLSPLKYLFFDNTEDLLYGIIPEQEDQENKVEQNEDDEFDGVVFENDDDGENNENEDDGNNENSCCKKKSPPHKENDIYTKMTVEEKAKLRENITILLKFIETEDCFQHLKKIVEGSVKSFRMELLNKHKDFELQFKSGGLGPFNGSVTSQTDQLFQILDNFGERLHFQGDSSLLLRNVLIPEAVIFALQREWKWQNKEAEKFYNDWTFTIPDWKEKAT